MGKLQGTGAMRVLVASIAAAGLSACGGGSGGGANVKPTPPYDPPTIAIVKDSTMTVAAGESVGKPILMFPGSVLDNAGKVGAPGFEYGVRTGTSWGRATVLNHDGGSIQGKDFGLQMWNGYAEVENSGAGSVIRAEDIAIGFLDHDSTLVNSGGATISGGRIGVEMPNGGVLVNGAGSTIEARDSTEGDCFEVGACAVYVLPEGYAGVDHSIELENAGTIIGDVRLDPDARNVVTLRAGSVIRGDLLVDSDSESSWSGLVLDGAAGTTQLYSQAVTDMTSFHGRLVKTGEGTWILDNDALARGRPSEEVDNGAVIEAGTLQVGHGGTEGPDAMGSVQAAAGGRLAFNRSDDYVFDASFEGEGTLVQSGTGLLTLVLSGNSLAGIVETEAGTRLQIGGGAMDASIANQGALVFDGDSTTIVRGGVSGAGSLTQDGPSQVILLGPNTYSGGTTINAGSLSAREGLPGDVTVNADGTLRGGSMSANLWYVNGLPTVGGDLSNGGRVVTGMDGTEVGGNYVQSSTGTLAVSLGSKLEVAGTATLEGGTLEVRGAEDGYIANTHTEVLTAAGGVSGTFDALVKAPGLVFHATTIHYDANSVWLDTTGLDITYAATGDGIGYTVASMNSAERVQGAFEQLNRRVETGTLAGVSDGFLHAAGQFQRASSSAAAQASLRSLSGELHAAAAAMAFRAIDAGNNALSEHLDDLRVGSASPGMWSEQLGSGGRMARGGFDGVGFQLAGWLVGTDFRIGQAGVAGFAFGQGQGRQQLQGGGDRDHSHRTEGMVYAGLAGDRWYTQGRIGIGHSRQYVDRRLLLGDTVAAARTRYDGRFQVAHGESGLRFGSGRTRVAPFVSLEYRRSARDGFAEQGAGGFGLRSDAQSLARWQSAVGVRAAHGWNLGNGRTLDIGAHAQWHRSLGGAGGMADASFVGLRQWAPLVGIGLSEYGRVLGVGLDARLSRHATFKVGYDFEVSQYSTAQAASARLQVVF